MHSLGILLALLSAPSAQTPEPTVGKYVLPNRPGVAVVKDCRVQRPEVLDRTNDVAFRVVEVRGDWLRIYTAHGMGWVARGDVLLPEDAVALFSARIRADARDAEAWGPRGVARVILADVQDFGI